MKTIGNGAHPEEFRRLLIENNAILFRCGVLHIEPQTTIDIGFSISVSTAGHPDITG